MLDVGVVGLVVVAQAGDQGPAWSEGPVHFTEHCLVFDRGIALDGTEQFIVEEQPVVKVVGVVTVVDAGETLHRVAAVVQAQLLTEQVAILLAQNGLVGVS